MKVKQGKVLHWFVEKPRVEEGSDLPPTGSCRNLSRFAGCTSNGIDHHNHDDEEEDIFCIMVAALMIIRISKDMGTL